ncbi:hypothetical protein PsYK624_168270 [Phanerochaete sordida]|uniref:Uncharacterized protein n=1 Tax=Phanerochaete sordida TaxID=48140 RepID=A0A9P3GRJ4_9APHY|nr:hypothetical protein PsYK624_168270 [Phanerochaete sordida]
MLDKSTQFQLMTPAKWSGNVPSANTLQPQQMAHTTIPILQPRMALDMPEQNEAIEASQGSGHRTGRYGQMQMNAISRNSKEREFTEWNIHHPIKMTMDNAGNDTHGTESAVFVGQFATAIEVSRRKPGRKTDSRPPWERPSRQAEYRLYGTRYSFDQPHDSACDRCRSRGQSEMHRNN